MITDQTTIDQMIEYAQRDPEGFSKDAHQYQLDNLTRLCNGDAQKEWRAKGLLFRLEQEVKHYKDPVARLNFVMARFWSFINENY